MNWKLPSAQCKHLSGPGGKCYMAQLSGLLFFYFNFYHVVLVSAIQLKTAITMHPSPASGAALPSFHPFSSSQSASLGSLCRSAASHHPCLLNLMVHATESCMMLHQSGSCCYSLHLSPSFPPHCVQKSVLCTRISIPSLEIGSSIPFF